MGFSLSVSIVPQRDGFENAMTSSYRPSCSYAGRIFGDYFARKRKGRQDEVRTVPGADFCWRSKIRILVITRHIMAPNIHGIKRKEKEIEG